MSMINLHFLQTSTTKFIIGPEPEKNIQFLFQKDLSFSTSSYDLRNHAIYIANVDRSLRHFGIDAEDMYTTDIVSNTFIY